MVHKSINRITKCGLILSHTLDSNYPFRDVKLTVPFSVLINAAERLTFHVTEGERGRILRMLQQWIQHA
jgi:hypothetical protein